MTRRTLTLLALFAVACGDKDTPPDDTDVNTDDSSADDSDEPVDTGPFDTDGDGTNDADDCAPEDAEIHPGAEEVCDGVDNDCSGEADDDATDATTWYADVDTDGFGDDGTAVTSCEQPSDTVDVGGDCDDSSGDYHPDATEDDCADPNDYNCDGSIGYDDADGDGWAACEECDDTNKDIHPDATEVCDGVDNDCDTKVDDDDDTLDASTGSTFYLDDDGDSYGVDTTTTQSCEVQEGWADNADDCDDTLVDVNPGESETYYNGLNDDCDADDDCDQDGDGEDVDSSGSCTGGDDCDDGDSSINTSATDTPQNGTDEDCSGTDAPYAVTDLSGGDLLISELMPAPDNVNDSVGEWIEVYNASGGQVDLDGLYITDEAGSTTLSGETLVEDGEYAILARSSSGDVTPDATYSSGFSLNDDGDTITLYESSSQATEFDSVDYNDFTVTDGYSLNLGPDYVDEDLNDFRGHWCDGSTEISSGGDIGTPGAENDDCGFTYTHDTDIQTIWTTYCTGCHGNSGSMSLASSAWSTIVDTSSSQQSSYNRIEPGEPDNSYLYAKLKGVSGTNISPNNNANMPKNNNTVTSTELAKLKTWIEEGAPK